MSTHTMSTHTKKKQTAAVTIKPPNITTVEFLIEGTTPYVQHKFSAKMRNAMRQKQEAGSTAKKGSKREPKDFDDVYKQAIHFSEEGWIGIPASSFRAAMISACRLVGYKMTLAKLSLFVVADGLDADEQTPLIRIMNGEPEKHESMVRVANGAPDITVRPLWRPGWQAVVRIQFDADQFTVDDVANLLSRVGMQVGIGEGRPDSKMSCGMGWGLFKLVNE